MLKYNIYYNNEKINSRPLDKDDIDLIKKERIITKTDKYTNDIKQISTDKIEIVKCYVI
jgi:hypothetical protein